MLDPLASLGQLHGCLAGVWKDSLFLGPAGSSPEPQLGWVGKRLGWTARSSGHWC